MADNISKNRKSSLENSEFELIERIRIGDEHAFRDMFKTYYPLLVNFARRYVCNISIAEDIVEDVFLKIWQNRQKWNPTISVKAYLFQTIRNRALNYLKRSKMEQQIASDLETSSIAIKTPEDILDEKEMLAEIQLAIEALPKRARSIFTMHRYDQLKYAEIAETLNISVGTVETHMVRALKFLRKRLAHFLSTHTFV